MGLSGVALHRPASSVPVSRASIRCSRCARMPSTCKDSDSVSRWRRCAQPGPSGPGPAPPD
eukprot:2029965-Lingulodinium_polyedra.AAC.1